jgi:NADH-quinone oxidoreductase subunit G
LPYDTIEALRARLSAVNPVFGTVDSLTRLATTDTTGPADGGAALSRAPFAVSVPDYYQTDPISRASPTMQACTETVSPHLQAAE